MFSSEILELDDGDGDCVPPEQHLCCMAACKQVLPQLLNHLDIDAEATESPDWGVIAVYSCSRSCHTDGYAEEFAWLQPIQ